MITSFFGRVVGLLFLVLTCPAQLRPVAAQTDADCVAIERRLPPEGLEIPKARLQEWQPQIAELTRQLEQLPEQDRPDIEVLVKACELAIRHREIYRQEDLAKVELLLKLARQRLDEVQADTRSWTAMQGLQARGFRSAVDGSVQPIGLVFPEPNAVSKDKTLPLYVWLHGRGDKTTDLHFIVERLHKVGQISPAGAIVLHPFGRQCVGYKSAGETDVMEAIDFVCANYPVDKQRIVLMGFSMGGAGVWHLAAHYGDRFVAASPGAGFAETARYQGLKPDDYPPKYEQMLWRIYDVPGYCRNLFQFPVVAYSGELDKQMQAANVMAEAFASHGHELTHLIGPGMGHKYHPDTLAEIMRRLDAAVQTGRSPAPTELFIQSPHLRYARRGWLTVDGVEQQYGETRVDAKQAQGEWHLETQNASRLIVDSRRASAPQSQIVLDGQSLAIQPDAVNYFARQQGHWQTVAGFPDWRKHPGVSGPIDDAFIDPFLVVEPTGARPQSRVDEWVRCELQFFKSRWRALMRGEVRSKPDTDVTAEDIAKYHLVVWGTPNSNSLIGRILAEPSPLPLAWNENEFKLGQTTYSAADRVPSLVFPNPLNPKRYVVFNSGLTFRPGHDRTNSLQNPHLPDWAVIGLEEPRGEERPGAIVAAGFFDDKWDWDPNLTW